MVLQRRYPLLELRRTYNRLYQPRFASQTAITPSITPASGAGGREWSIPLDIVQEEDRYVVRASLPGIAPENIEVSVDHGVLTIKGRTEVDAESDSEDQREDGNYVVRERRSGSFIRSLRLPDTVDADQAEPNYDNGVLTITLPKLESKKAKHLTVTVGKAPEGRKE